MSSCSSPWSEPSFRSSISPRSPSTAATTPINAGGSPTNYENCDEAFTYEQLEQTTTTPTSTLYSNDPLYANVSLYTNESPYTEQLLYQSPLAGSPRFNATNDTPFSSSSTTAPPTPLEAERSTYTGVELYGPHGLHPTNMSPYLEPPPPPPPPPPRWTGYPPASAFYGPLLPPMCPPASAYQGNDPSKISPWTYKAEEWYTADGRKVESSAMHWHCATM